LPQLRKLERKYSRELVVIGVHSAKFPAEKNIQALRQAVLRHGITHPVINDGDFRVWNAYAVRAWPTLMFIDPTGKVVGRHEGEFPSEAMDQVMARMIAQYEHHGILDRRSISFRPEATSTAQAFTFPGKILADPSGDRLFIADTGRHRIVEVSMAGGTTRRIFGDGEAGLRDGLAAEARFQCPEGLALSDNVLFVADTENHSLRRIDLQDGRVRTIAGTGQQAMGWNPGGPARKTALNSPWDVAVRGDQLFVAMAGCHQIWLLDLPADLIAPWAGTGRENIQDGLRHEATFAQPSGLALDADGQRLFVADSEVSGIRVIELRPPGRVRTLVGQGLFEFGDQDGEGPAVRLQHPLGLAFDQGTLYVADSYNHKIKRLDPNTSRVETLLGRGEEGFRDGDARDAMFFEPAGLSVARGKLFIADTNNHCIRVADLARGQVSTLHVMDGTRSR
jgi:DNA-binding beta-propeller fold protein YncE